MTCETVQELISSLVDDQLPAAQRALVQQHSRTCLACAEARAWLQETKAMLRKLAGQHQELPPAFWAGVRQRIDAVGAAEAVLSDQGEGRGCGQALSEGVLAEARVQVAHQRA